MPNSFTSELNRIRAEQERETIRRSGVTNEVKGFLGFSDSDSTIDVPIASSSVPGAAMAYVYLDDSDFSGAGTRTRLQADNPKGFAQHGMPVKVARDAGTKLLTILEADGDKKGSFYAESGEVRSPSSVQHGFDHFIYGRGNGVVADPVFISNRQVWEFSLMPKTPRSLELWLAASPANAGYFNSAGESIVHEDLTVDLTGELPAGGKGVWVLVSFDIDTATTTLTAGAEFTPGADAFTDFVTAKMPTTKPVGEAPIGWVYLLDTTSEIGWDYIRRFEGITLAGGDITYYQTMLEEGVAENQRAGLNFIDTATISLTLTDDAGNDETEVTADLVTPVILESGGTESDLSATGAGVVVQGGVGSALTVPATLVHEYGGLEADVSAYNGLVKISGGATSAVAIPLILENGGTEADLSATGPGALVQAGAGNAVTVETLAETRGGTGETAYALGDLLGGDGAGLTKLTAGANDTLVTYDNGEATGLKPAWGVLDEDAMGSDSDTNLSTQQAIKAYVDAAAGAIAVEEDGVSVVAAATTLDFKDFNVEDDGGNQAGIYHNIPRVNGGRLSLTSGDPIEISDVTAQTTLYFVPYHGTKISLYDGTRWKIYAFTERSISIPATTDTNYDVFLYDNSGTLTLELVAWTNDTTRATAITTQNGIYVKSGATTRRYLGTIRTTDSSGECENSVANRFVWNYYNRTMKASSIIAVGVHTYASSTIRAWNNDTTLRCHIVVGVAEEVYLLNLSGRQRAVTDGNSNLIGFGLDTTSAISGNSGNRNNQYVDVSRSTDTRPGIGYHFYQITQQTPSGSCSYASAVIKLFAFN